MFLIINCLIIVQHVKIRKSYFLFNTNNFKFQFNLKFFNQIWNLNMTKNIANIFQLLLNFFQLKTNYLENKHLNRYLMTNINPKNFYIIKDLSDRYKKVMYYHISQFLNINNFLKLMIVIIRIYKILACKRHI